MEGLKNDSIVIIFTQDKNVRMKELLPDALLHSIRSLLRNTTNSTLRERLFSFTRKS